MRSKPKKLLANYNTIPFINYLQIIMKKIIISNLIVFLALFAMACNENQNDVLKKDADKMTINNDSLIEQAKGSFLDKEAGNINDGPNALDNSSLRSKVQTLDPLVLASFLPLKINNFEHNSLTTYSSDDGYASVSTIYKFAMGKGVEIRILDNGPTAPIMDERYFRKMPTEVGMMTRKISLENAIGFVMISEDNKNANLSVLFNNRLNIVIRLFGLEASEKQLEEYLKLFKINEILQKLK